jgi:ribokinase
MHDIITIGSALVDIFISSKSFHLKKEASALWLCEKYDEKIEIESFKVTTGGGGSNTAVGFVRMGFTTGVVSELGMDSWSELLLNDFKKEQVGTELLVFERKEETGGSVILSAPNGVRTIMVHRGAASMLDAKDIPDHALVNAKWIHLSSISGQQSALQKIFSLVSQHKKQFSWNPGKAEIKLLNEGKINLTGINVTVLFVNQKEWTSLTPVHAQLHQQCVQIVVTNSDKGGTVYQSGKTVHQYQREEVETIDGTGAGDAFAVGYVAAILNGVSIRHQADWARKNASSVVSQIGSKGGLLTKEQLEKVV